MYLQYIQSILVSNIITKCVQFMHHNEHHGGFMEYTSIRNLIYNKSLYRLGVLSYCSMYYLAAAIVLIINIMVLLSVCVTDTVSNLGEHPYI
jgi:hypothetical protein